MDRVMTVSDNSKKDIHTDHKVPLDRIHVVPVGVDSYDAAAGDAPATLIARNGFPSRRSTWDGSRRCRF